MRDVVYRHDELAALAEFLRAHEQALPLAASPDWADGQWVLAIFEVGTRGRATAAVGVVTLQAGGAFVSFDGRDWERIHNFAATHADDSLNAIIAAAPARPKVDSLPPSIAHRGPSKGSLNDVSVHDARVLVVDPDAATELTLRNALVAIGVEVVGVATAGEGLAALERGGIEVVVAEFELQGSSGVELCRRLRDDDRFDALPVMLLTSLDDWRVRTEAFGVGADDWLHKPADPSELAARVLALVRRYRHARRQLGTPP